MQVLATILEKWAIAVKKENSIFCRENAGFELPGFSLVSRRGNRSIRDPLMVATFLQEQGVPVDRILAGCRLSVPEIIASLYDVVPDSEDPEEFVGSRLQSMEEIGLITRGMDVTFLKQTKVTKEAIENATKNQL